MMMLMAARGLLLVGGLLGVVAFVLMSAARLHLLALLHSIACLGALSSTVLMAAKGGGSRFEASLGIDQKNGRRHDLITFR
jgi:hypothetical protein